MKMPEEGFEDFGNGNRSNRLANRAMMFMLQGIGPKRWKQPIAYYFAEGTTSTKTLKV